MPDIYFSFFMFTANLQPDNREYTKTLVSHMRALLDMGYVGFDLPIAPGPGRDFASEVKSYQGLRQAFDDAGLRDVGFTTNVGATRTFDPSSMYKEQRELGLQYLKSRIDITKALRGEMLAGPIILPYGVFPMTDGNQPIWSDDLHDWLEARYSNANPTIEQLGQYAAQQGIKVADALGISDRSHVVDPAEPVLVGIVAKGSENDFAFPTEVAELKPGRDRERTVGPVRPAFNQAQRGLIRYAPEEIVAREILRVRQGERQLTRHNHQAGSDPPPLAEVKPTGPVAASPV